MEILVTNYEFPPMGGGGTKNKLLNGYSRPAGIIKNSGKAIKNINWCIRFLVFPPAGLVLKMQNFSARIKPPQLRFVGLRYQSM